MRIRRHALSALALLLAAGCLWLLLSGEPDGPRTGDTTRSGAAIGDGIASAPRGVGGTPSGEDPEASDETTRVGLRGSAPSQIRVRVLEAGSGDPLPGATVRMIGDSPAARDLGLLLRGDVLVRAETDEAGVAVLDPPSGALSSATRIAVSAPDRVPTCVDWERGVYMYDVALAAGTSMSGQVEDAAGRTVPGVVVRVRLPLVPIVDDRFLSSDPQPGWRATLTDDQGRFEIRGLRLDTRYEIDAYADGWAMAKVYRGLAEQGTWLTSDADRIRIRLDPVRVALVRFVEETSDRPLAFVPENVVFSIGEDEIPARTPAAHRGAAHAFDGTRWVASGFLRDAPALFVEVVRLPDCVEVPETVRMVAIWEYGWARETEVRLRLPSQLTSNIEPDRVAVQTALVDAETGTLIVRETNVNARYERSRPRRLTVQWDGADGPYALTLVLAGHRLVNGDWVFKGIPTGRHTMSFHVGERARHDFEAAVTRGGRTRVDLSDRDLTGVCVEVRGPDGRRAVGFELDVTSEDSRWISPPYYTGCRMASTDTAPRALLYSLEPGRYRLGVEMPGSVLESALQDVTVEAGKVTRLRFQLRRRDAEPD